MVIQVIPAPPPKKNLWAGVASGLASGLTEALAEKNRERNREAASQRDFELENRMRHMKNIEEAEKRHIQRQQEDKQYEEENKAAKQMGVDLSGVRNPQMRQKMLDFALKGKTKSEEFASQMAAEEKANKELYSFADRLEQSNPNSPVHKTIAEIYRTGLPMEQKSELVKTLTGVDPFKVEQQKRLQLDSVLKRYNSRLKELDSEINNVKNPNSTGREEADALRKQRMALRSERDQLLDFRALNGMDQEEAPEEDEEEAEEETERKVKFNPANKKHRAKAEALWNKFKDKEKVRKALSKEFEGL